MLAWLMNMGFAGGGVGIIGKLNRTSETWLTRVTREWILPFFIK